VIITALIDALSNPLITAALATGKIKKYQIVVGGMLLLNLPVSFCFLKLGFMPEVTMYVAIVISTICLFLRLQMLKGMVGLSISDYFKKVIRAIISVSVVAYGIPIFLSFQMEESLIRFIIVGITGVTTSITTIYFLGLSANERQFIIQIIKSRVISRINPRYAK
jgi:hypothetical protein